MSQTKTKQSSFSKLNKPSLDFLVPKVGQEIHSQFPPVLLFLKQIFQEHL